MRSKKNFHFLWKPIATFKWPITLHIILITIASIILCIQPYILKIILDKLSNLKNQQIYTILIKPIAAYIILEITIEIAYRISDLMWVKINPNLTKKLTINMMNKMMAQSSNLYKNTPTGNISNKIKDVISLTPEVLKTLLDNFLSTILTIIASIITLFFIKKIFSLLLITWTITFLIVATKLSKKITKLSITAAENKTKTTGHIVDLISNISSVILFSGRKKEKKILEHISNKLIKTEQTRDMFMIKTYSIQSIIFILYQIISITILIQGLKNGTNTIGDFGLILNINLNLIHEMWFITEDMGNLSKQIGSIIQGLQIILKPIKIYDKPKAKKLKVQQGKIEFNKVTFHHKGTLPLFHNTSISIKSKEKIGLIGYSGSGKTTFTNLILRLFQINNGKILIDNQNIDEVTQKSLRDNISLVPQDITLFHRSILENIRYSKPQATHKQVIEASKKACAHDFITKLPQGYNTIAGEKGLNISGGERQRIAIARAILKNTPILILDEATSNLDSLTEKKIQTFIHDITKDKTTIFITHRLNTLLNVDRILVFEKGKIVQDGTHKDLIKKQGPYKTLWDSQKYGFLPQTK